MINALEKFHEKNPRFFPIASDIWSLLSLIGALTIACLAVANHVQGDISDTYGYYAFGCLGSAALPVVVRILYHCVKYLTSPKKRLSAPKDPVLSIN